MPTCAPRVRFEIFLPRPGPELSGVAREALLPAVDGEVIETVGTAGDVMLAHPLLLHARCVWLIVTRGNA